MVKEIHIEHTHNGRLNSIFDRKSVVVVHPPLLIIVMVSRCWFLANQELGSLADVGIFKGYLAILAPARE